MEFLSEATYFSQRYPFVEFSGVCFPQLIIYYFCVFLFLFLNEFLSLLLLLWFLLAFRLDFLISFFVVLVFFFLLFLFLSFYLGVSRLFVLFSFFLAAATLCYYIIWFCCCSYHLLLPKCAQISICCLSWSSNYCPCSILCSKRSSTQQYRAAAAAAAALSYPFCLFRESAPHLLESASAKCSCMHSKKLPRCSFGAACILLQRLGCTRSP